MARTQRGGRPSNHQNMKCFDTVALAAGIKLRLRHPTSPEPPEGVLATTQTRIFPRLNAERLPRMPWIPWFACAIGTPFVLGAIEPHGAVTYQGAYGFAAFGMLLGILLPLSPSIRFILDAHRRPTTALYAAGAVLTVTLTCFEISRLSYLTVDSTRMATESVGPLRIALFHCWTFWSNYEKPLAFLSALLCGAFGSSVLAQGHSSQQDSKPISRMLLAGALCSFACGLTRGWAWSTLLPHPAFPLSVWHLSLTAETAWVHGGFTGIWFLPFLLSAWLGAIAVRRSSNHRIAAFVVAPWCLGELAMRLAARIDPTLLAIGQDQAIISLLFHLLCLAILSAMAHAATQPDRAQATDRSIPTPHEPRFSPLSDNVLAIMQEHGLTVKEISTVQAALDGLKANELARLEGISPSTVRVYRMRACKKLGFSSVDQVAAAIVTGRPPFNEKSNPNDQQALSHVPGGIVGIAGTVGALVLVTMPYGPATSSWDLSWVTAFGIALGLCALALCRVVQSYIPNTPAPKAPALRVIAPLAFMLCCFAAIVNHGQLALIATEAIPIPLRWSTILILAGVTASGAFVIARCRSSLAAHTPSAASLALTVITLVALIPCVFPNVWSICLAGTAVVGALGCLVCIIGNPAGRPPAIQHARADHGNPVIALSWCTCLAFTWEELWRGQIYSSLIPYCLPFLVVSYGCTLLACHSLHLRPATIGISCIATVGSALCEGIAFGCFIGIALSLLACLTSPPTHGARYAALAKQRWSAGAPLIAAAFGMLVAVYCGNEWGAHLLSDTATMLPDVPRSIVEGASVGIVLLACSLLGLSQCIQTGRSTSNAGIAIDDERLRGFLQSKAITGLQANVIVALVHGERPFEIADSLAYSPSTIAAARKEAYATLGIQTKAQLLTLIKRACTGAQSENAN